MSAAHARLSSHHVEQAGCQAVVLFQQIGCVRDGPASSTLVAAWGTCFHGKSCRAVLRSGSLGNHRQMFACSYEAVNQKTHKLVRVTRLCLSMGSISPQSTPAGALLPMLFAKAASSKQPSGWWCQPCPSGTFLSPVQAAGRHAGQAPGAAGTGASPPLVCVTDSLHVSLGSGCLPAALLLQRGSRGRTSAVSA